MAWRTRGSAVATRNGRTERMGNLVGQLSVTAGDHQFCQSSMSWPRYCRFWLLIASMGTFGVPILRAIEKKTKRGALVERTL